MNEDKFFEGVASLKLLAKKEVGQNFLIDPRAAESIVNALDIQEGERVLEIGCGAGSLTYFLSRYSNEIDAIDIDEAMLLKTGKDFEKMENLHVIYGNAAKWDYSSYDKIVGNLPYYITSLLVERALMEGKKAKRMVFMVQKEAAARLLSHPGSKDYGPLPIYLSLVANSKKLFNVGRNSFTPIPHVDSSVLRFDVIPESHNEETKEAYKFSQSMFLQRRKTIFNNLKSYLRDDTKSKEVLASCGIEPTRRPDAIPPLEYLSLYRATKRVQ